LFAVRHRAFNLFILAIVLFICAEWYRTYHGEDWLSWTGHGWISDIGIGGGALGLDFTRIRDAMVKACNIAAGTKHSRITTISALKNLSNRICARIWASDTYTAVIHPLQRVSAIAIFAYHLAGPSQS
jgi:hypothetical protein